MSDQDKAMDKLSEEIRQIEEVVTEIRVASHKELEVLREWASLEENPFYMDILVVVGDDTPHGVLRFKRHGVHIKDIEIHT